MTVHKRLYNHVQGAAVCVSCRPAQLICLTRKYKDLLHIFSYLQLDLAIETTPIKFIDEKEKSRHQIQNCFNKTERQYQNCTIDSFLFLIVYSYLTFLCKIPIWLTVSLFMSVPFPSAL